MTCRKMTTILLVCMLLLTCLVFAAAIRSADHECPGEGCEICVQLSAAKEHLERCTAMLCAGLLLLLLPCRMTAGIRYAGGFIAGSCSPVQLKVKLSN